MRRKIALIMPIAALAVTAALFLAGVGSSSPPPMPSASQLATLGVTLASATTTPPGLAVAQAAQAAASQKAGADVLNSEYVNCQVPGAVPAINQDCYVELMNPAQLGTLSGGGLVQWEVVLVDPATSKPLIGLREEPNQPVPVFTRDSQGNMQFSSPQTPIP